jgi:hypothetical protein
MPRRTDAPARGDQSEVRGRWRGQAKPESGRWPASPGDLLRSRFQAAAADAFLPGQSALTASNAREWLRSGDPSGAAVDTLDTQRGREHDGSGASGRAGSRPRTSKPRRTRPACLGSGLRARTTEHVEREAEHGAAWEDSRARLCRGCPHPHRWGLDTHSLIGGPCPRMRQPIKFAFSCGVLALGGLVACDDETSPSEQQFSGGGGGLSLPLPTTGG